MKKQLASLLILTLSFLPATLAGQQQNDSFIEVKGYAERSVHPDKITLSITVSESDYRNNSLADLEKSMKKSLSDIGIDIQKSLKVSDMSSIFAKAKSRRPDALLSKNYTLTVSDAATAAGAITVLEEAGISKAYITKSEYSAIDSLKMVIRAEAVKNAKETASVMTSAIGQTLGPAFYIYEQENGYNTYQPRLMMAKAANSDSIEEEALPELEFQEIKVTSHVIVKFRL